MNTTVRKVLLLAVILSFVSPQGCSSSGTAPATATPTQTDTPSPTSTPTKVPPPVTIWGCFYAGACASAFSIRNYFSHDGPLNYNVEYPATVYTGDEVWFSFEWCAADRATLEKNLENMEFTFTIDGNFNLEDLDRGNTSMQDHNDPSVSFPCYSIGGALSGWQNGKPHKVVIGATFLVDISNGWSTHSAGDYLNIFLIMPSDVPTPTPPSSTPTASPTLPVAEPCVAVSSISIKNETDSLITMSLTGPATFTYTLQVGWNYLPVCAGSYSYTAIMCGGSRYGTIRDEGYLYLSCLRP